MDMYTHLPRHIAFIQQRIGHTLKPDEYIFPYFGPNSVVQPSRQLTQEMIQVFIHEFSVGAGLEKMYTTHCFRRGGAQYRFMFAPFGERWSLSHPMVGRLGCR
ncbi:hypothetical protein HGRIS_001225 [Hohenbuehelia grisea]|uniref:Uncharacterized protein n=1 Tax=Hohenbuehelia grisea TaxID=104357 RepID=A0ABR3JQ66_9AGAR